MLWPLLFFHSRNLLHLCLKLSLIFTFLGLLPLPFLTLTEAWPFWMLRSLHFSSRISSTLKPVFKPISIMNQSLMATDLSCPKARYLTFLQALFSLLISESLRYFFSLSVQANLLFFGFLAKSSFFIRLMNFLRNAIG